MLYYLLAVLYVVSCLLLLLVVLLQQGKGGDMANAFGGGGSQAAFGARAGATVLTNATSVLGVLFMIGAIALGVIGKRGETSLMGGLKAPVTNTPAPVVVRTSTVPAEAVIGGEPTLIEMFGSENLTSVAAVPVRV